MKRATAPPIYLPAEPLLELAQRAGYNDRQVAELVGTSHRTVQRWRHEGHRVRWMLADRAAIALGSHPVLLWGPLW